MLVDTFLEVKLQVLLFFLTIEIIILNDYYFIYFTFSGKGSEIKEDISDVFPTFSKKLTTFILINLPSPKTAILIFRYFFAINIYVYI